MSGIGAAGPHLDELRGRVLRVAVSVAAIAAFLLAFHAEPAAVDVSGASVTVYYPVPDPLDNMAAQMTEAMGRALVPDGVSLIQTAPGEAFFAQVHIAALAALAASMPLAAREAAAFVRPALEAGEARMGRSLSLPAAGLFAAGCAFAYLLVVPYVLEFLYRYGESAGLVTFLNVMDFVGFVLQFMLAFGASFQLPLAMYAATAAGIVGARFWRSNMRYAVVAIVIFGAAITPDGSGVTMWFVGGPMIVLYLAGMALAERRGRERGRREAPAAGGRQGPR